METFVVALQEGAGPRLFFAESEVPPWTHNLLAATQYLRRYDAEGVARKGAAMVLTWREAYDYAFSPADAAVHA